MLSKLLYILPRATGPMGAPFWVTWFYGIFCTAVVCSKLIRLVTHAAAIPLAALIFYFPTFLLPDLLAACVVRLLLRPEKARIYLIPTIIGILITLPALGGAASQLSFFYETGGELEWREASSYVTNKEGLRVLLTGSGPMIVFSLVMIVIGFFIRNFVYGIMGSFVASVGSHVLILSQFLYALSLRLAYFLVRVYRNYRGYSSELMAADNASDDNLSIYSDLPSDSTDHSEDFTLLGETEKAKNLGDQPIWRRIPALIPKPPMHWVVKLGAVLLLIIALAVRPRKPYDHMTVTLPLSLLDMFGGGVGYCQEQRRLMDNEWPLPELLDNSLWEAPEGNFKGWAPGVNNSLVIEYKNRTPEWLPEDVPYGFFRWDPMRFVNGYLGSHGTANQIGHQKCPGLDLPEPFYNPVNDPLKISNLDTDILGPIKEALDNGEVKIKHVVFILMESLREELFPLRSDSDIVKYILKTNKVEDRNAVNDELAHMTPHLEKLSGLTGNFRIMNTSAPVPELIWEDKTREGYGGVNVIGGYTGSTMSTKSFATNHCGAWMMPVEKFEEAETYSYQPCLPQIMDLWNRGKSNRSTEDYLEQKWYPALFQAVTEEYDRQERFDDKIGFKYKMTKTQLMKDWRYNKTDPLYQKVNYFGFSEPVLKPYITEYIANATADGNRMFMTHFTSTTHHNWDTPDWFNTTSYMPTTGSNKWHKNFNKYLNTVRFHDQWMGELMQLIDDFGIANETLVVFAGDHGQAFKEDYRKTGTYEVPHISDFHIPINFRHPNLPRVQYTANASTVSVLPTILDLLIHSGSLNEQDKTVAEDIIWDYEGQSLIRPYKKSHNGRRAWNFSIINSGAGMLAVTSADVPYRFVMPLNKVFEYRMTDLSVDPLEHDPLTDWAWDDFIVAAEAKHGVEGATWAREAEAVGKWWGLERQRLWRYHSQEGRWMT